MNTSRIAGLLVLSLSMAHTAELVQWIDLPKKVGHGKMRSDGREDRQYRVVTKDAVIHAGYELVFSPRGVNVVSGPFIPREEVTEIRIHRDGRFSDALWAPGGAIASGLCRNDDLGFCLVLLGLPVDFGVSLAAAPITLPIEGIKRLLPDKVIKVAQ
ncbi:MAG TPA: hypothetical protein VGP62_16260 [Bryobacteraceae bacterium]|jgi:hypothetical protein|nr:hypothetical protein [Bryobacteraceae bacterium]